MTITFRPVDPDDWPAAAAGFADLTFEQTRAYAGPAAARIGGQARFLLAEAAGAPVAAAALRIKSLPGLRRGIAWCPAGPLVIPAAGPAPDAARLHAVLAALRAHVADADGHILRLRIASPAALSLAPETLATAATGAGFAPTDRARGYHSAAIDLSCDADALMRRLSGKWRTDVRFALKSGLTLEHGIGAGLEARFLSMFDQTQTAKGFSPDIPPQFHFPLGGPDYAVETLIASKDGEDLAGIVVGAAGRSAVYLFGATLPAGRPLRAGYFLTWEAIRLARERGLSWYDLGGIDVEANPDVARFKERMNGEVIHVEPWEARPTGVVARLTLAAERLRSRLRRG